MMILKRKKNNNFFWSSKLTFFLLQKNFFSIKYTTKVAQANFFCNFTLMMSKKSISISISISNINSISISISISTQYQYQYWISIYKNVPNTSCMVLTKLTPTSFLFGNAWFTIVANHKSHHYEIKSHLMWSST